MIQDLKDKIKALADEYFDEVVGHRRYFHSHPELSYHEYETSAYIQKKLTEYGVSFKTGFVNTGVIAVIEGKNPDKKCIALRADMDALPILEKNETEYTSQNEGVMHACGHDAHSASLLGVAKILTALKDTFEGKIVLIFQPAEEKLPGGAKLMLEEKALESYNPECVIAQHVLPTLEAGKVGFRGGMYMASCDELYITVRGKGGHGAMPHQLADPVLAASHIVVALQQIVSRNAQASVPSVLSIGKVIANGATNVIPEEVKMEGTFRTMDELWRDDAHKKMVKMAESIAEGMGCTCDFKVDKGYPCLINDEKVTALSRELAEHFLGKENVIELDLRMTSEDFSYFSHFYPVTMYRLGVRNEAKNLVSPLHSGTFDIDEESLRLAIGNMAYIALSYITKE